MKGMRDSSVAICATSARSCDFLHGVRREHRPAGGAARHHVGVVAEDRERMRGQGAGGDVHGGRGQFTGDLVHVGDHQQQALGGRKRGGECTGLQCAVQGAGSAAFALQFFHDGQCAPDILLPFRAPLIGPLGHRRRGGDRDRLRRLRRDDRQPRPQPRSHLK